MFCQSFMGWINYYIQQYSVSLIMHKYYPVSAHFETLAWRHASCGGDYGLTQSFVYRNLIHACRYFCALFGNSQPFPASRPSVQPPGKLQSSSGVTRGRSAAWPESRKAALPQLDRFSQRLSFPARKRSNNFAHVKNYVSRALGAWDTASIQTLFLFSQPGSDTCSPPRLLKGPSYLQHHAYPAVPFNTY